jgi:hypothetical protein
LALLRPRALAPALVFVLLHALAREVDQALGLVLRAEVEPAGLLREVARALAADGSGAAGRVGLWLVGGLVARALLPRTRVLAPLLLRPAVSAAALASVALQPSYPFAFTLPVALTQDWSIGQDAAALAALVALRAPALRWPAPRARDVLLVAFLGYGALVPERAWRWEHHPGNEPKYLRQAVALGHGLTFDAEGVSAAMEDLPVRPAGEALAAAAGTLGRESAAMARALARGEAGRDAIRATRITRQTIRGKDGGVYYVLAPGPSMLLAPTLRADRALNRARGVAGRVAVSVLLWCALAALLVAAVFRLVRDATGRPGIAAALAFGFGLLPPFLFYFFQFYPEMIGALVLAVAFRTLALAPEGLSRHPWAFGWLIATLPWLHQKFLPVWLVVAATALAVPRADTLSRWIPRRMASRAPRDDSRRGTLPGLLLPQAVSAFAFALYNFAITGSARPDALFLAWGPGGVTSARVGQGLLGLPFDARYGLLPYVPLFALAAAGLAAGGARRFAAVLPAAAVYYVTVASADNWSGAVCNLGRYVMPLAPLAVALAGIAIARATGPAAASDGFGEPVARPEEAAARARLAVVLVLTAWSAILALALWRDPIAANDSALLLAKSTWADGQRYVPGLFFRRWSDAAPGLAARIAAWLALVAFASWALLRARRPLRTFAAGALILAGLALGLERWPGVRTGPTDPLAFDADPRTRVFVAGAVRRSREDAILGPGRVRLLVRHTDHATGPIDPSGSPVLRVTLGGSGTFAAEGRPAFALRPTGGMADLPLADYHRVRGSDGREVLFSVTEASVEGQAVMRFAEAGVPAASVPDGTAPLQRAEPGDPGLRSGERE